MVSKAADKVGRQLREERARSTELSERVFDVQQECTRLDFTTRGTDSTAHWVAGKLSEALAQFEGVKE